MDDQRDRDRVGNRIAAMAVAVLGVLLAYVFWPSEPMSSTMGKASAALAVVLAALAIGLAALIW